MKRHTFFTSCFGLTLVLQCLTGCGNLTGSQQTTEDSLVMRVTPYASGSGYHRAAHAWELQAMPQDRMASRFSPFVTHKTLNDYASQLAMQLVSGSHQLTDETKIGVASFVTFDASLRQPTVAGNQLAEHLMSQMQSLGINVVEFKMTKRLVVNEQGDLVLSRKVRDLMATAGVNAVLTGTLMQTPAGVEVNARIIATKERELLASSQLFIPGFMLVNPFAT